MHIAGINKNTLLDYPGKVAATVFTGGCNLRCLFCQNSSLVDGLIPEIKEEDVIAFLEKRRSVLSGVCISGGEPTLQPDLAGFIDKIRSLGYDVKLDTNGTMPDILRKLADEKLVNYIALDIKTGRKKYRELCNVDVDLESINESVELLLNGNFPDYEFRTTVVAEYFDKFVWIEPENLRGDYDLDDELTIMDATRAQNMIADLYPRLEPEVLAQIDADGDDELTIMDATRVQNVLAELMTMDGVKLV